MREPFPGASGRGVRIGVADSGVNPHHPHVGKLAGGVGLRIREGRVECDGELVDLIGHGTAVAATIRGRAPEAELFSIRIFRRRLDAPAESLLAAIEWATKKRYHLLNLSLGLTSAAWGEAIAEACLRAERAGVFVVAAAEVEGVPSLPGSLCVAVGVEPDPALAPGAYRWAEQGGRTVFFASPWARGLPGLRREKNLHGSSLAVANLTGVAARAVELHRPESLTDLEEILRAGSTHGHA